MAVTREETLGRRPASARLWRWHLAAFGLYAVIAVIVLDHGTGLGANILGQSTDRFIFIWCLEWWRWAVSHHLDAFFTDRVWQPSGVSLLWITSVPFLALITLPVTVLSGPVVAYNLVILTAPVLSAWMMYRVCVRVTNHPLAALIGGYIFGFSSYEMGQDLSAINFSFTALIPGLLLVALMRLDGEMERLRAVLVASLLLVCQFFVSAEIFATSVLFGGIAWLVALGCFHQRRRPLRLLFIDGLWVALVVAAVLSPFLYEMFCYRNRDGVGAVLPFIYVTDIANLVVPSAAAAFGGAFAHPINGRFICALEEQDAYLGLPLILLICLYAREPAAARRYLLLLFGIFLVASCGPALWVGGRGFDIVLPWNLIERMPLISSALPARFALYVSIVSALIAARWIAGAAGDGTWRLCLGVLACAALLPARYPASPTPDLAAFAPGRLQAALGSDPSILVLPFGPNGPSSYWQEENHFGFLQTGGYLGYPPPRMARYPAVYELSHDVQPGTFRDDFVALCSATRTQFVVAGPGTPPSLFGVLASLRWPERHVDDVTVFTVPAHG